MLRNCDVCGTEYQAKRPNSQYCSDRCRKRAQRAPEGAAVVAVMPPVPTPDAIDGGVYAATLRELEAADQVNSSRGQKALSLARRIDSPGLDTGSSVAALVREHGTILDAALDSGVKAVDPLDELEIRRRERRNRAHA